MTRLRCVHCGTVESKRVVYGYPGPELIEAARRGEVVLGGCNIGGPPPRWLCEDCERTLPEEERCALLEREDDETLGD